MFKSIGVPILLFSAMFIFLPLNVFANGKQHHQHDSGMTKHMQEMIALKEEIPEEYRIMERTPVIPDEESVTHGKQIYMKSCSVCHGETGNGKGPAATSLKSPPANFLDLQHSAVYGPGEKFWIIGNGSGKTGMPAFSNLSALDRWHLVNYILHLQQADKTQHQEHGH